MEIEKPVNPIDKAIHQLNPQWEKRAPHYTPCDIKDCDAIAKAVLEKGETLVDYPFKFPEMKPYELRARILYTGICHTDCHLAKSDWWESTYPLVPGHEIITEVTHVGAEVTNVKVGDHVGWGYQRFYCGTCDSCKVGKTNLCVGEVFPEHLLIIDPCFGGYATHIQAPARCAVKIPDGLPLDKIPPLFCAGVTMYAPIKRHCGEKNRVGIIGCGGLGHMGIKIAKALGHTVTAFTTKVDEKKSDLMKMGAEKVVSSLDHKQMYPEFESIDVLVVTIPNEVMKNLDYWLKLLKHGGICVLVGIPKSGLKLELDCFQIVWNQIAVVGSNIGTGEHVAELLQLAVKDKNVIPESEVYEWEDFQKAFDNVSNSEAKYRGVVNTGAYAKKHNLK